MVIRIVTFIGYFALPGAILMLDIYGNQQIAFGCLYVFFIFYSWLSSFPRASIFLGLVSSLLIFVSVFINYDSSLNSAVGVNMLISHAIVWVAVAIVYLAKQTLVNSDLSRAILDTEVKERTFELKQREKRIQAMINVVQEYSIILLDKNGFILTWNEGLKKIKSFQKEDVIGKSMSIFYNQEARKENIPYQLLVEATENGFAVYEGLQKKKTGETFYAVVTISVILDRHNSITGFTQITRDLTESQKLELSRKKQHELQYQNEELEKFAFYTSHDLQEPLLTVESFVNVILEDYENVLDETGKKYLNILSESVKKMRNIIKELLLYAKITDHTHKEKVNLQLVVSSVLDAIAESIKCSKAIVHIATLPEVYGSTALLNQMIQNLVLNAIKFQEKNVQPIVKIYSIIEANHYKIIVEDNGIGIDSKFHEKIFQPFNRLHVAHKYAGSGIGLAQCKRIAQIHGGSVSVDSTLGKGSSFYFYLPII